MQIRMIVVVLGFWLLSVAAQQPPAKKVAPKAPAATTAPTGAAVKKAPAVPSARPRPKGVAMPLTTQKQKASYSIGLDIGETFKKQEMDLDAAALAKGIQDALSGGKRLMTEKESGECLALFRQEMMSNQEGKMRVLGERNKFEGEKFLAANKTQAGVVVLPSGLQYRELVAGTGVMPKASDTVITHYRGTLLDGSEFDSSSKRGEPARFAVTQVIRGWTEALQLMKVGAKWQLFVPSNLAYGERSPGPEIGPSSTLIFEIELIGIQ
jgi:FKBP-type peptidyl-prolyl cis-trans isomerase FklB